MAGRRPSRIVARVGHKLLHAHAYRAHDWRERDNFDRLEPALAYAKGLARSYGRTPYRVVKRGGRFVVQYVPAELLRRGR